MDRTIPVISRLAVLALAGLLITAPGTPVSASEFTFEDFAVDSTEDLLDVCTVSEENVSHAEAAAFCYGFFQGAVHYHQALATGPHYAPIVCPAEPPHVRQVVSVFVDYARANTQHMAEPAIDTAFRALIEQWPCS